LISGYLNVFLTSLWLCKAKEEEKKSNNIFIPLSTTNNGVSQAEYKLINKLRLQW
jgi:hypothetical protein